MSTGARTPGTGARQRGPAAAPEPPPPHAPTSPVPRGTSDLLAWGGGALALLLALAVVDRKRRSRARASPAQKTTTPTAFLNDITKCTGKPSYRITADKISIIGRLPGAPEEDATHVVIDESTVGRRHAIISYRDHAFWLADQNSLNGTFVNRQRISQETRLKHGDRLRFHKFEFEFLEQDMFETDRTMFSETQFREPPGEDGEATIVRRRAPTLRG